MGRLGLRLNLAEQACETLREALAVRSPSTLERDGAIQRFEYSFEAFWKAAQAFVELHEGLTARSPRSALRGLGRAGILSSGEITAALAALEDRNLTVHTYIEELSVQVFGRLAQHESLMSTAVVRMREALAQEEA